MTAPAHGTASPTDVHVGGQHVSVSYLRDAASCRRLEFWRYRFVWPDGSGRGVETKWTSMPLLIGSAVHAAVAAWRLSGWQTGQYDGAAALAAAREHAEARRDEFESEDTFADALAEATDLVTRYCTQWAHEYPDVRVWALDGQPAIERLFEVPLGESGLRLNVRPDAVVIAHDFLAVMETKTASASRAGATFAAQEVSPQTLAELWVLRSLGDPAAGIYVDVAVKGNTRTVEKFQRRLVTVDERLVDEFPALVQDMLADVLSAASAPYLPLEAQLSAFPMTGMLTGRCDGCPMRSLCWNPGREAATLAGGFRPRNVPEVTP
jgi:hypothetical protein